MATTRFANQNLPAVPARKKAVSSMVSGGGRGRHLADGKATTCPADAGLQKRVEALWGQEIEYIIGLDFETLTVDQACVEPPVVIGRPRSGRSPRGTSAGVLPEYLIRLCETPLLSAEQEVHLFRKMNFLKFHADRLRAALPAQPDTEQVNAIEQLLAQAHSTRNRIIQANLRLVISIAKKYVNSLTDFDELISEGNFSLLRAVEKFNYALGNRFSTYATRALKNNFNHFVAGKHRTKKRFIGSEDKVLQAATDTRQQGVRYERQWESVRLSIASIVQKLDEEKRDIVLARFGLDNGGQSVSLKDLGHERGVSRERIRQIQSRALGELRELATTAQLEPLDKDNS